MKQYSEIQSLLDRYWEGETTLDEERLLKSYFASGQIDERFRSVAPLFQVFRDEQALEYTRLQKVEMKPRIFAWHGWAAAASVLLLLSAGWWWISREKVLPQQIAQQTGFQKELPAEHTKPALTEDFPRVADEKTTPKKIRYSGSKKTKKVAVDPEAEKAMAEIKAALALVSSKIGKGRREAAKGAIYLENVDKIFKKKPDTEG